jgi:hypothetical protein
MIGPGLLIAVCASAVTPAQVRVVWPTGYDSVAGGAAQEAPFSVSSARLPLAPLRVRSAVSIAGATLPFGPGTTITAIALRRDALYGTTYPAQSGQVQLHIGTIASAEQTTGAFNLDWQSQSLAALGALSLPAASRPSTGAAPFGVRIPFQKPWVYPGGDLRIDLTWTGVAGSMWRRDAVALGDRQSARAVTRGSGCPGSEGRVAYAWVDPELAVAGGVLDVRLEGAVLSPILPAVHLLGFDRSTFNGAPLPASLGPVGGPAACFLHTDVVATQVVPLGDRSTLYSRGRARWPVPADPTLVGSRVSAQSLVPDPAIGTRLPFTASNALGIAIGAPVPPASASRYLGRTAWKYGAVGWGNDGGVLSPRNYVPIIEFEIR